MASPPPSPAVVPPEYLAICQDDCTIIVGTPGDDELEGTPGCNCIYGLGGDDTIDGRGGMDYIFGMDGDDLLYGGAAGDVSSGGLGDDVLYGEKGEDQLFGYGETELGISDTVCSFPESGPRGSSYFSNRRHFTEGI